MNVLVCDNDLVPFAAVAGTQVEALLSRYEWEHCINLQGDCGDEADFPSLQEYARYCNFMT
jgi:hypothetical protein